MATFNVNGHNVNVQGKFPCLVKVLDADGKPEVSFTVPDCDDDSLSHILDRLEALGDTVLKVTCKPREFGSIRVQKRPSPVASELGKMLRALSGASVTVTARAA